MVFLLIGRDSPSLFFFPCYVYYVCSSKDSNKKIHADGRIEKTDDKKCDIFSVAVAAPFFFTAQWAFLRWKAKLSKWGMVAFGRPCLVLLVFTALSIEKMGPHTKAFLATLLAQIKNSAPPCLKKV